MNMLRESIYINNNANLLLMHCLDGVDHDPASMQLISNEVLSVPKWNPCLHIYEIDSWNCQVDFEGGVTNSVLLNSVGEEHTISAK